MSHSNSTSIDVTVKVLVETQRAYLVTEDDDREVWVPKSQVQSMEVLDEEHKICLMTISEWLAKEKEFI